MTVVCCASHAFVLPPQGLPKHLAAIEEVSEYAAKEYSLERLLDKMQADWGGCGSCCCWLLVVATSTLLILMLMLPLMVVVVGRWCGVLSQLVGQLWQKPSLLSVSSIKRFSPGNCLQAPP